MFDKKQKSCVKRIHFVTDNGLYNRKAFYIVKIVFTHPLGSNNDRNIKTSPTSAIGIDNILHFIFLLIYM